MTVSTTKNRIVFVGDGATKLFGFDFKVIKAEHAKVYLVVNDVETLLILGTEYTISGLNNDTGGAVEIETPPAQADIMQPREATFLLRMEKMLYD